MLYSLFQLLPDFPGSRLMTYISFRAIVAAVLALLISIYFGKYFIAFMKRKHISEVQRDEKTDPFNVAKKGVPTMGGIVIIFSILLPVVLIGNLSNIYLLLMLITTLILGALGFADDYIKTFRRNKDGLNGWVKIAGQVALGLIVGLTLRYSPVTTMNEQVSTRTENNITIVEKSPSVKSTQTTIPFVKHHNFNYADLFSFLGSENKYRAGWIFFVLLTVLVVAAVSNGANLNDGMDGMCAGKSAIIGAALIALAYISGSCVWADYFDVMYIPGSEELVVFLASFVGALVGFLWYNGFPAQIFMGDTGSLTIGIMLCFLSMQVSHLSATTSPHHFNPFVMAFAPLLVPCFDVVRVYLHRVRNGKNPFLPDKNHIHHKLLAIGMRQRTAMVTIVLSSIVLTFLNILFSAYINSSLLLCMDIALWTMANIHITRKIRRLAITRKDSPVISFVEKRKNYNNNKQ